MIAMKRSSVRVIRFSTEIIPPRINAKVIILQDDSLKGHLSIADSGMDIVHNTPMMRSERASEDMMILVVPGGNSPCARHITARVRVLPQMIAKQQSAMKIVRSVMRAGPSCTKLSV